MDDVLHLAFEYVMPYSYPIYEKDVYPKPVAGVRVPFARYQVKSRAKSKHVSQKQVRSRILFTTAGYVIGMLSFYGFHLNHKITDPELTNYPFWLNQYYSIIEALPYCLLLYKDCRTELEHDYRWFIGVFGLFVIAIRFSLMVFHDLPGPIFSFFWYATMAIFFAGLLGYTAYCLRPKKIRPVMYKPIEYQRTTDYRERNTVFAGSSAFPC